MQEERGRGRVLELETRAIVGVGAMGAEQCARKPSKSNRVDIGGGKEAQEEAREERYISNLCIQSKLIQSNPG